MLEKNGEIKLCISIRSEMKQQTSNIFTRSTITEKSVLMNTINMGRILFQNKTCYIVIIAR